MRSMSSMAAPSDPRRRRVSTGGGFEGRATPDLTCDCRRDRGSAMPEIGMSDEVRELRGRMKDFIDNVVMKAEPELDRLAEQGYHPETGLPLELYEAAEAKGLDTSRGLPGPGDAATRRSVGPIADLQA